MTTTILTQRTWASTFGAVSLAVYMIFLFSYAPLTISLTIHKSAVHLLQRYKRHHAIQLRFDKSELASLKWVKPNKEFKWQGDMYDVIALKKDSCGQIITCFKDVFETQLLRLIRNASRRTREQFTAFIIGIHLFYEPTPIWKTILLVAERSLLPELMQRYTPGFFEHTAPPPEA